MFPLVRIHIFLLIYLFFSQRHWYNLWNGNMRIKTTCRGHSKTEYNIVITENGYTGAQPENYFWIVLIVCTSWSSSPFSVEGPVLPLKIRLREKKKLGVFKSTHEPLEENSQKGFCTMTLSFTTSNSESNKAWNNPQGPVWCPGLLLNAEGGLGRDEVHTEQQRCLKAADTKWANPHCRETAAPTLSPSNTKAFSAINQRVHLSFI